MRTIEQWRQAIEDNTDEASYGDGPSGYEAAMLATLRAFRDEVIEEAAKVCDRTVYRVCDCDSLIAANILKLKERP